MSRTTVLAIVGCLFLLPGKITEGASLSGSSLPGYVHVILDQPRSQLNTGYVVGEAPISLGYDTFWTSVDSFWLTDSTGMGSFHVLDLTPIPDLVAVRASEISEDGTQDFGYEYHYGSVRTETVLNLPIQQAPFSVGVPEPAIGLLGLIGAIGILGLKRKF